MRLNQQQFIKNRMKLDDRQDQLLNQQKEDEEEITYNKTRQGSPSSQLGNE